MRIETKGATSIIWQVFVSDSSSTTGAGLTGLVYNSTNLVAYYNRSNNGTATAISLADMTLGTWTSAGFKKIDDTNMPGWYQFCVPNAVLATGCNEAAVILKGATNMAPLPILVKLTAIDLETESVKIQTTTKKATALAAFPFLMTDTDGNAALSLTVTAQRSLDGAAFASCANSVSEIGYGWYKINLAAADLTADTVALRFSATGARDTDLTILTLP